MQNLKDLELQLYQVLKPFVPDGYELKTQTDLVEDLNLDSMKVMDIVAEVEDAFDISVPLNILPDVRTVGDFTSQIQNLLKEGS
jgi:acyl carrier protein